MPKIDVKSQRDTVKPVFSATQEGGLFSRSKLFGHLNALPKPIISNTELFYRLVFGRSNESLAEPAVETEPTTPQEPPPPPAASGRLVGLFSRSPSTPQAAAAAVQQPAVAAKPAVAVSQPATTRPPRKHNAGPITRNPYLNYMRHKRTTGCRLPVRIASREAAGEWRHMSEAQRLPFVLQAFHAKKRRQRRVFVQPLFNTNTVDGMLPTTAAGGGLDEPFY